MNDHTFSRHVSIPSLNCQNSQVSDLANWTRDHSSQIKEKVLKHGGVIIEGLPCHNAQDFDTMMSALFSNLNDYVGGTSPRDVVHNKIMSATRTPEDWSIIPHQEMAYTSSPPDLIAFFCKEAAQAGGDSTVTDMRQAAKDIDPGVVSRLKQFGLQLCRTLPSANRVHLKPGIQKSWEEVFGTDWRPAVEEIAQSKGWKVAWRGDDLNLWQEKVDAFRVHQRTGESIWCNQAHFFNPSSMVAWAERDGRRKDADDLRAAIIEHPDLLDRMHLGNGDPVSDSDAMHILETLQYHEKSIALRATDIMILDNVRLAHGRTAFKGARELLVALAQWDNMEVQT